jgi:hypothetical protein
MVDKDAIREELEATRSAYHELLASISDRDWPRKSANPDMTVKELMWHTAWALGFIHRSIDSVSRGRGFNPPGFLVNPLRGFAMHLLALRATREKSAARYDQGHARLITRLDAMRDEDWAAEARIFGETRTALSYFEQVRTHFEEHGADVRTVVEGRAG